VLETAGWSSPSATRCWKSAAIWAISSFMAIVTEMASSSFTPPLIAVMLVLKLSRI
jgi:hypothetical protein